VNEGGHADSATHNGLVHYQRLKEVRFWLEAALDTLNDAEILKMWRHAEATRL